MHRQIVDRAQRRFEQQLAKSEHELNWAMRRRRDLSASSTEKRQANECLKNLRTTLNHDYTEMIQVGELLLWSAREVRRTSKTQLIFIQAYVDEHKVCVYNAWASV